MSAVKLESPELLEKFASVNNQDVNDSIISLFECPVCFDYLLPPIYQCRNSHQLCSPCKSKIDKCPSCQEPFLAARSVFAEQIAVHLLYPCKNLDAGCYEKYALKDIAQHHTECVHRLYDCLPGKESNCEWKGRNYEILTHVTESHADKAWMDGDSSLFYESNIFEGIEDLQIVSACQEIFWYNFKCDAQKQKMYLAVQFIGLKDLASNFTYELVVCAETDAERSIALKSRTHSDIENVNEIYGAEKCITLDFAILKNYISGVNSTFILRIVKVVSKEDLESETSPSTA